MIPSQSLLEKHRHIFIYYQMFLKANQRAAREWHKKRIYLEISRPFYIDPQRTAKIISKLMKAGYTPSKIDIEDFNRTYSEVTEIQNRINGVMGGPGMGTKSRNDIGRH